MLGNRVVIDLSQQWQINEKDFQKRIILINPQGERGATLGWLLGDGGLLNAGLEKLSRAENDHGFPFDRD